MFTNLDEERIAKYYFSKPAIVLALANEPCNQEVQSNSLSNQTQVHLPSNIEAQVHQPSNTEVQLTLQGPTLSFNGEDQPHHPTAIEL